MKIVEEQEVRRLVSAKACVDLMKEALMDLETGKSAMPQRLIVKMPNTAVLGFMPAWAGDYFGAKVLAAYGPNAGTEYPTHMGYVVLFESEHCSPVGLIDATAVTEIRTGAVSAAATDVLARKDAKVLALVGAGAEARSHTAAILAVRNIEKIRVYDLRRTASEDFKAEIEAIYDVPVEIMDDLKSCVYGADIVCTLTPSKQPFLTKDLIAPGTHINAVGTFTPVTREVASDLVAASRLYADQTAACKKESGEYLIPLAEGLIGEDHIVGSIGEVLLGKAPGRESDEEITIFDALGLAVEDVYTAKYAYLKA